MGVGRGISYISYSGFEGQANICEYDSMILNLTHAHLMDRIYTMNMVENRLILECNLKFIQSLGQ